MLRVVVSFYLNEEGMKFFTPWFGRLRNEIVKQNGFITIQSNIGKGEAKINLSFDSQENLSRWAQSSVHQKLNDELSPYFTKPKQSTKEIIEDERFHFKL